MLVILSQPILYLFQYEKSDNSAQEIRFSGNDQFIVFACNLFKVLVLSFHQFKPLNECYITYPMKNLFVYSLTVIINNDNTTAYKLHSFV